MFYEPSTFEFVSILESNWLSVKQELIQVHPDSFRSWLEKVSYGKGWDLFAFYVFGRKISKNCILCPKTTELLESLPGMTSAGFSRLSPKTFVHPHKGPSDAFTRCHLCLITPNGCSIRVGTETRNWQEGKCVIFEDTIEHEAWNQADTSRFILLIDFKKDIVMETSKNLV